MTECPIRLRESYFGQVIAPMLDGGWQPAGGIAGCLEK